MIRENEANKVSSIAAIPEDAWLGFAPAKLLSKNEYRHGWAA